MIHRPQGPPDGSIRDHLAGSGKGLEPVDSGLPCRLAHLGTVSQRGTRGVRRVMAECKWLAWREAPVRQTRMTHKRRRRPPLTLKTTPASPIRGCSEEGGAQAERGSSCSCGVLRPRKPTGAAPSPLRHAKTPPMPPLGMNALPRCNVDRSQRSGSYVSLLKFLEYSGHRREVVVHVEDGVPVVDRGRTHQQVDRSCHAMPALLGQFVLGGCRPSARRSSERERAGRVRPTPPRARPGGTGWLPSKKIRRVSARRGGTPRLRCAPPTAAMPRGCGTGATGRRCRAGT